MAARAWLRAYWPLVALFALCLIVALAYGTKRFVYDSYEYWFSADRFSQDGSFSLLDYDDPLRGYLTAVTYGLLRELAQLLGDGDGSVIVKAFNAGLFTLIGAVLAPRLAQLVWPERVFSWPRRAAFVVLLLVFWGGYLNYPLSDLPALAAALIAIVCVARQSSPAMFCAGLAAAVAIDMRPAYVLLLPALVALAVADRTAWRARSVAAGLIVVGAVVVLLPQSILSHRHHETWSPLPGTAIDLSSVQLTVGLSEQRYDTYIGGEYAGAAQMRYEDPSTTELVRTALGPDGEVGGFAEYGELIVKHPVTMAGVGARHVINGLDQRYSTPYVETVTSTHSRVLRIASWTFAFLALLRLLWPAARHGLGPARWRYLAALAVTWLPSIPSRVETRFMLPIFVIMAMLVLAPGWPRPATLLTPGPAIRRYRTLALIAAGYVLTMLVFRWVTFGASTNLVIE